MLYAVESSSDYDPAPMLEKIQAPLLAINSADDLINPPDLGILERDIQRVKNGRAITIPEGPETRGHGTHTHAVVWKRYLAELLQETNPRTVINCDSYRSGYACGPQRLACITDDRR